MFKRSRVRSWVAVLLTFFFVVGLFPNTTPEAWAADGIEITRISPDAGSAGGCIIEIQGSGLDNVNKVDVLIGTYIIEAQLLDPTSYSKVFALLPDVSTYMGGAPEKSVTIRVITDTGESDSCNFVFIADPSLSGMTLNTDIYLTRNAQGQITGSTKETQAVLTGTCLHRPLSTWRIGERPVNVLTDIRHQDYSLLVGKLPDGLHMGQEVNVYLETVYGGISDLAGDDAVMLNPPPDITNLNKNQVVVGEELLIQGTGFVNGSEVEIAGGSVTVSDEPTAENRVSIDGKTIHIKVPQPLDMTSGKKDVRVILPNGSSATLKEELEILPTPGSIELKTVTPNRGSVNGGTVVQIVGFGLQSGMQVFFGDQAATNVTLVNPPAGAPPDTTILQATTPIGPPLGGPVNVTVRDPFNPRVIGILHEGFTYAKVGDDLYVGKVTPENGVETGGEEVWVEGSNFLRFRDGGTDRKINGTDLSADLHAPDFGEAILRGGYTYDRLFPEEPTGFKARLIGDRYVQLSWQPVEGASNYELFAQTDDDEDLVFLASTDQTSYLLKTVKEGEDYYFQLRAVSDKGASPLIKADRFPLYVGYIDEEDDEDEDEDEDERPASVVNLSGDNLNIIIGNRPKNEYYLDYLDLTGDEYSRVNRVQIAVPLSLLQANRRVLVKTPRYDLEFSPRALYTQEVRQVERGAAWANWITDSAQIYVYLILQPLQPRDVERATSKLGTNYKLVGGTELLGEVRVGTRAQAIQSLNGTIDLTLKVPARQWSASETGNIYVLDPAKREWNNLFGSTNPAYGTGRIQVRRSGSYGLIVKKQW